MKHLWIGVMMLLTWQSLPGQEFSVEIRVENGGISQTLIVGLDSTATSRYDSGFDRFAPPPPPSGNFDARIRNGIDDFYTDFRSSDSVQTFRILYSSGSTTPEIHLSWRIRHADSVSELSMYSGYITDHNGGGYGPVDLAETDSLDVSTNAGLLAAGIQIVLMKEESSGLSSPEYPEGFTLFPNYPNPFNPTTTIQFELEHSSHVFLTILNARGETIQTLIQGSLNTGRHAFHFDGSGLSSGVYFYRFESDRYDVTRQMMLLK